LIGLARKQGKTQLIAALALFFLVLENEPGGEIYVCAGDRDQARRIFEAAKEMLLASPALADECQVLRDAILHRASGSVLRVLSADAPTKHGLNPSCVLFDELHVQPNRDLWDVKELGPRPVADPAAANGTTKPAQLQRITIDQARFAYKASDGDLFVLGPVSFTIDPGERVALVVVELEVAVVDEC
jgi:phage terminase large subunit-like protein